MKSISIIIPTKNRPASLALCLQSLRNQIPGERSSIITVVDDGSEFSSATQNEALCRNFSINYVLHERSQGIAAARNTGIEESDSAWVTFVDDDITIDNGWFTRLETLIKHSSSSCIGFEGKVNASGDGLWDREVQNLSGGAYLTCNITYRRDILLKENGFDTCLKAFCEDHELAARMLIHGTILFDSRLSVTHSPRKINYLQHIFSGPSRIRTLIKSECYFYCKHPDRYHQFRGHYTFFGTLRSIVLFNVIHTFRRRSFEQCLRQPGQTLVVLLTALIEQIAILDLLPQLIGSVIAQAHKHFLPHVDKDSTMRLWSVSRFDERFFTLKPSLLRQIMFRVTRKPVYNSLSFHKTIPGTIDNTCSVFIRVDDVFLDNTDSICRFSDMLRKEGVPLLVAIPGKDLIDPALWPCVEMLRDSGACIGIHGFLHKGTFGPFASELLQMNTITFKHQIDPIISKLTQLHQTKMILIPPFNAIGRTQIIAWSKMCPIICGGPETVRFTDRLYGPLALESGGWYFPSISPFYSNSNEMIKLEIPRLLPAMRGPICLTTHFQFESKDDYTTFSQLIKSIHPFIHSWDETARW